MKLFSKVSNTLSDMATGNDSPLTAFSMPEENKDIKWLKSENIGHIEAESTWFRKWFNTCQLFLVLVLTVDLRMD